VPATLTIASVGDASTRKGIDERWISCGLRWLNRVMFPLINSGEALGLWTRRSPWPTMDRQQSLPERTLEPRHGLAVIVFGGRPAMAF